MRRGLRKAFAAGVAVLVVSMLPTTASFADGSVPNPAEVVDTTLTPEELAASLVGPGVTVENVALTGDAGR
jgi:hypothetical protein